MTTWRARFRDFYLEAHRRAVSAHLLVINHALLVADVEAGGQVLPEYDNLIVDEAHHLENAATDQFTRQVDLRVLASLLDSVAEAVSHFPPRIFDEAAGRQVSQLEADRRSLQATIPGFFELLLDFALRHRDEKPEARSLSASANGYPHLLALDNRMRAQPEWSEIEIQWDEVSAQLNQVLERLTALAVLLEGPSPDRTMAPSAVPAPPQHSNRSTFPGATPRNCSILPSPVWPT